METIFVGDLSFFCTEENLESLFSSFGVVRSAIIRRGKGGENLQYGFVQMEESEARKAVAQLKGQKFMGRKLRLNIAENSNDRSVPPDRNNLIKVLVSFVSHSNRVNITEEILDNVFSQYGEVEDCTIKHYSVAADTGKHSGYGFVYFEEVSAAFKAIETINGELHGHVQGIIFDCHMSHDSARKMSQSASTSSADSMENLKQLSLHTDSSSSLTAPSPRYSEYFKPSNHSSKSDDARGRSRGGLSAQSSMYSTLNSPASMFRSRSESFSSSMNMGQYVQLQAPPVWQIPTGGLPPTIPMQPIMIPIAEHQQLPPLSPQQAPLQGPPPVAPQQAPSKQKQLQQPQHSQQQQQSPLQHQQAPHKPQQPQQQPQQHQPQHQHQQHQHQHQQQALPNTSQPVHQHMYVQQPMTQMYQPQTIPTMMMYPTSAPVVANGAMAPMSYYAGPHAVPHQVPHHQYAPMQMHVPIQVAHATGPSISSPATNPVMLPPNTQPMPSAYSAYGMQPLPPALTMHQNQGHPAHPSTNNTMYPGYVYPPTHPHHQHQHHPPGVQIVRLIVFC